MSLASLFAALPASPSASPSASLTASGGAARARTARAARHAAVCACLALGGCLSNPPPVGMPNVSVIGLRDGRAVPPDCAVLATPTDFLDAGTGRPANAFGCATYTNLAAMLARPADLAAPRPFAGADAAIAASAVRRYETGKVTPLPSTETSNFNK